MQFKVLKKLRFKISINFDIFTYTSSALGTESYTLQMLLFLGSTISCPSIFVWNPSVGLCYKVEEVPLLWQDAKVHCESKGARLAVLDIPPKLDVLAGGM